MISNIANESTSKLSNPLFNDQLKKTLAEVANTIRCLSMDAVQAAGSGHAGTPMGCAELGAYLYGFYLKLNPKNMQWLNRDRFILSAGHASMLQYSCFHLNGSLSLDELKKFRRLNSKTPSHPQYCLTDGIETTTGVDGQGVAHAAGQALGLKLLAAKFNRPKFSLYDSKVIVLAGDGCLMEGVSHEACSLAGHLNLNNLILIYDRNKTSLDGFVTDSCSEDTRKRYLAYGWDVYEVDGHDFDAIHKVFEALRTQQKKPCLVIADTIIGKGAPIKAGNYLIHSEPVDERLTAKAQMGFPNVDFFVPKQIYDFFTKKGVQEELIEASWSKMFQEWMKQYPDLYLEFQKMKTKWLPEDIEKQLLSIKMPVLISGRKASNYVINFLGDVLPGLYGGSADLARSDMTHMERHSVVTKDNFLGKNIKYGVREFGMTAMAMGLSQTQMILPFVGTFLSFSDYMMNAIRMSALMKIPMIYQLTHDSIFIGQDGPTHQPVEHLAHLRAIPGLQVLRPADSNEIKMAWLAALKFQGPTAIILSRQDLPLCAGTDKAYKDGVGRGAYILKDSVANLDYTLVATGSEVSLALEVSSALQKQGLSVRVISMPSWELFDAQPEDYKNLLFGSDSGIRVSIEAACELGWHKYIQNGKVISMQTFGKSALPSELAKEFGFTVDAIVKKIVQPRLL